MSLHFTRRADHRRQPWPWPQRRPALAADGADILLTYRSRADAADAVVAQIGRWAGVPPRCRWTWPTAPALPVSPRPCRPNSGTGRDRPAGLFNNAGEGLYAGFADTTPAQFDELVAVHLKGPYFLTCTAAADRRWRPHPQRVQWHGSLLAAGQFGLRDDEGRHRGLQPPPPRNWARAGSVPTRWHRARSKPTSAAGMCVTTPTSTRWWPATPRWAAPASRTISGRSSPRCCRRVRAGSTRSGWRRRAACSSECESVAFAPSRYDGRPCRPCRDCLARFRTDAPDGSCVCRCRLVRGIYGPGCWSACT